MNTRGPRRDGNTHPDFEIRSLTVNRWFDSPISFFFTLAAGAGGLLGPLPRPSQTPGAGRSLLIAYFTLYTLLPRTLLPRTLPPCYPTLPPRSLRLHIPP
ncbi:hypothetical protein F4781DRAFT_438312 [Annulohypoxylon bovei var. microspora]|nr:hypothetical protein F4781DRAFT_438312 [Annulohypoxylon bovei var. microspora]